MSKVIAVIPNYNMAEGLKVLLPQLIAQKYDKVYVVDDLSTDDSVRVANSFKGVTVIKGTTNVGAGANRNRVLKHVKDEDILHFLDADVVLKSDDVPNKIRRIVKKYPNAIIGGQILHKSGHWHQYNYGPKGGAGAFVGSRIHELSVLLSRKGYNSAAKKLRRSFLPVTKEWPDITSDPVAKKVFWVTEGNLIMPVNLYRKMNGFNESLREHEILEFGMRLKHNGYTCMFDPEITVLHTALKVRPHFRLVTRSWYHAVVLLEERKIKRGTNKVT